MQTHDTKWHFKQCGNELPVRASSGRMQTLCTPIIIVCRLLSFNRFIDCSCPLLHTRTHTHTMLSYLLCSMLPFNSLIYTHIDIHFYLHSLWPGQWPRGRVHPVTDTTHPSQTLDWFRLITPVSCLVPSPSLSHCRIPLMMFTLFDSLTEPLSHSHSLLSYFLLCRPLPLVFPLSLLSLCLSCCLTFLTLLLLLQLFLAESCVQWLSLPHKQKNLEGRVIRIQVYTSKLGFFFF